LVGNSARHKAPTYTKDNTNTENTYITMPRVGFELTTPVFERAKTVHALDLERPLCSAGYILAYVKFCLETDYLHEQILHESFPDY
jgi:hypothetical protein